MAIRAVLFDLDDTLIPEEETMREELIATCAAPLAAGASPSQLVPEMLTAAHDLWHADARRSALGHALGVASWEVLNTDFAGCVGELGELHGFAIEFRVAVWEKALRACGLEPGSAPVLAETFRAEWRRRHRAYGEVTEVLRSLRGNYAVLLLTNGPDLQREKLDRAGLGEFFDGILISGEMGIGKPDERFFQEALRRASVGPEEAVMVGDSVERDVIGAQGAGISAVLVDRRNRGAGPANLGYAVIRDLREIHSVVRK